MITVLVNLCSEHWNRKVNKTGYEAGVPLSNVYWARSEV